MKLHLGCGSDKKPGWVNIDGDPGVQPDRVHDLSRGIPFDAGSVDFIYAEHFLEHLTWDQGQGFLKECHRVLTRKGVLRLSVPDLSEFVRIYICSPNDLNLWQSHGWTPKTRAQMMNDLFRNWGHQYIYSAEDLWLALRNAGFESTLEVHWGQSQHEALRGLETRPEAWNDLQMEATR